MRTFLFAFAFLLSSLCFGGEWTLDDTFAVQKIYSVSPSPNGQVVAIQIADDSIEEGVKSRLEIYRVGSEQPEHVIEGGALPHWSLHGRTLAYLSSVEEVLQLTLFDRETQESRVLTSVERQISDFQWSPDSRQIAFLMRDSESGPEDYRPSFEKKPSEHLWLLSVETGEISPLTDTLHIENDFSWSPDSQKIVFCGSEKPHPVLPKDAQLYQVDVKTAESHSLLKESAVRPTYSPDGKWIAYIKLEPTYMGVRDIWVLPAQGGKARPLARTENRDLRALLGWDLESQRVYVLDFLHTRSVLMALPLSGEEGEYLDTEIPVIGNPSLSGSTIGFVGEGIHLPPEPYLFDIKKKEPATPCAHLNADLPVEALPRMQVLTWKGVDGLTIEGILTYPKNYKEGERFPLLLMVHGGPAGLFIEQFQGSHSYYPLAVFAEKGYGVLQCNIRGSTGYGFDFRKANWADFGGKDFQDLLDGVDEVIRLGLADPDRLGVMGWSYGGYMSAWTVTQTDRFKAASVGAGVINLVSMTGTSDIVDFLPEYFEGEFWECPELYCERSPLAHVHHVQTPTLLQHGEEDDRVPVTQSYEFYHALQKLGVPSKCMIFPGSGHGLKDKASVRAAAEANLDWFDRYVPQ